MIAKILAAGLEAVLKIATKTQRHQEIIKIRIKNLVKLRVLVTLWHKSKLLKRPLGWDHKRLNSIILKFFFIKIKLNLVYGIHAFQFANEILAFTLIF